MFKQLICTETSASEQRHMTSTSKLTNLPLLYPSTQLLELSFVKEQWNPGAEEDIDCFQFRHL